MYKIIEEVPGIPDDRCFVDGPGLYYPRKHFPSFNAAKEWCDEQGYVPYEIEHFEP